MFQQLLRLSQTEQLLKQHRLDQKEYLQLSNQGATLIITLFRDIPVSKKQGCPLSHLPTLLPLRSFLLLYILYAASNRDQ